MNFWEGATAAAEPFSEDMFWDCAAVMCGESSLRLRDEYRLRAIEARAAAFGRTLREIRHADEAAP